MASSATFTSPRISSAASPVSTARQRTGFFARLMNGLAGFRQRQIEQQIGRMIELQGGKMTDSVERQIERRFLNF
jgi:hypothetical protein